MAVGLKLLRSKKIKLGETVNVVGTFGKGKIIGISKGMRNNYFYDVESVRTPKRRIFAVAETAIYKIKRTNYKKRK